MSGDVQYWRYTFGPFCVDPQMGQLRRDGHIVPIAPKALELLLLLASRSGEVVLKEELRAHAWQGTHVDAKNLGVQMVAVRKALNDVSTEPQYIQTVPRRGYRFLAPVRKEQTNGHSLVAVASATPKVRAYLKSQPLRAWIQWSTLLIAVCGTFAFFGLRKQSRTHVVRSELRVAPASSTSDAEARLLYDRGQYFLSRGGVSLRTAIGYFREAVRKDPKYAAAYAELAKAYICWADHIHQTTEPLSRAEEAATTALQFDPSSSDAWLAVAVTKSELHWEWAAAESAYLRAIRSDPSNATAHEWYGSFLMLTGKIDRAIQEVSRAAEINPNSVAINRRLGEVRLYAGDYQGAITAYSKALEMGPSSEATRAGLTEAYLSLGANQPSAVRSFLKEILPRIGPPPLRDFGSAYAASGLKGLRRERLEALLAEDHVQRVDPVALAVAYVTVGEKSKALDSIEKAFAQRTSTIRYLAAVPDLDALRAEPRFQNVLTSVRLPAFRHQGATSP